jgi:antirestriction protein ArdC
MPARKSRLPARRDPARPARDIAQEITDQIIALLEAGGELPWRKPWSSAGGAGLPLRHNGEPYRGINTFMLGLKAMSCGYASPYWMSFNQALELGAAVRKGEKSTPVVYYGTARKSATDDADADRDDADEPGGGAYRFLRVFAAFNAEQIDGLPGRFFPARDEPPCEGPEPVAPLREIVEAMTTGLGVTYVEGGDRACYVRGLDTIHMPEARRFLSYQHYVATRIHELAHATEAPQRLAIDYGAKVFGNEAYAKGELYAELCAAMVGAHLAFAPGHIEDHAAYVQSWLSVLRGDKRFILKASADAQRGADYLFAAVEEGRAAQAA